MVDEIQLPVFAALDPVVPDDGIQTPILDVIAI
jgi:hypothetical protein